MKAPRFILIFICSIYFGFSNDISTLAKECANFNNKSCEKLIEIGIPPYNKCSPYTCNIIGIALSLANKDDKALQYFKSACSAQYIEGCFGLALSYVAIKDLQNAKATYQLACEKNHTKSCYNLALLMLENDANAKYVRNFFKKSCARFYAKACYNLAVLYSKDIDKEGIRYARFYFDKACDLGLNIACNAVDKLEKMGVKMPEPKKIRGFYVDDF